MKLSLRCVKSFLMSLLYLMYLRINFILQKLSLGIKVVLILRKRLLTISNFKLCLALSNSLTAPNLVFFLYASIWHKIVWFWAKSMWPGRDVPFLAKSQDCKNVIFSYMSSHDGLYLGYATWPLLHDYTCISCTSWRNRLRSTHNEIGWLFRENLPLSNSRSWSQPNQSVWQIAW